MTQEDRWELHYKQVQEFMQKTKRRPSKHHLEDHRMLNWIKYNKKLIALGKLTEERVAKFNKLLSLAEECRRINQYAYADQHQGELPLNF